MSSHRAFVPQVNNPNYLTMQYLSRERWISFWYQLMEVTELHPSSVLEIGPGPGEVTTILRRIGMNVKTMDIDFSVKPTVVGDITSLPFQNHSFDVVLAAEVLEHIQFEEVDRALRELGRVAKKGLVITLPNFSHFAPSIALKIFPYIPRFSKVFPVTFPIPHHFDGQHYWEIGKRDTPLSLVKKTLTRYTGFAMKNEFLIEENPFHHMFVLKR